jgi:SAM-dependent methyltransferase
MELRHLQYLICPECEGELDVENIIEINNGKIKIGDLKCRTCSAIFPIINFIPRFVSSENYASNFGLEWIKHAQTQYDSYAGVNLSEKRFFEETKWPGNLSGEIILEAGSGSGRFTEQAAKTKAMIISFDYSAAVEANYQSNGNKDNVLIVQADIYKMPFRKKYFDRIFCFGVLQHTPDPKKSFLNLVNYLKKDGKICIDVYRKLRLLFFTKYFVRMFTRKMNPEKLYQRCKKWVDLLWGPTSLIAKLPKGRYINKLLFVFADYRGWLPLKDKILKEWAVLDTFDMLSPYYDSPQSLKTIKNWFLEARLENIEITPGYNGIEGRGEKI